MQTEIRAYWKRFAASVTAFANKFRTDQFIRTEFAVVFLQIVFALFLLGAVWMSFEYLDRNLANEFISEVVAENVRTPLTLETARDILDRLKELHQYGLWAIIGAIALTTATVFLPAGKKRHARNTAEAGPEGVSAKTGISFSRGN